MADFLPAEKFCFEFLQQFHPEQLMLLNGTLSGNRVAVICWSDTEHNTIRPIAIALNDSLIQNIMLDTLGKFVKDDDSTDNTEIDV